MNEALKEAKKAEVMDEVPVGAVIVQNGGIISRGCNLRETCKDATAHAEIIAIRAACKALGTWRLDNCDMYVTLEPCPMCAGAIVAARIKRLFIGALDGKSGACVSLFNITNDSKLNHQVEIAYGILYDECSGILKDFFKGKRQR